MSEKPTVRLGLAGWGLLCLGLLAVLAALITAHWAPLQDLDTDFGTPLESFTFHHHLARNAAEVVATIFEPAFLVGLTLLVALLLFVRNHRRAAAWSIAVMVVAALASTGIKHLIDRPRPVWPHPIEVLHSWSFPSGHATAATAGAGVTILLTSMLVRRRGIRRLAALVAVLVVLLVSLDRVLLGVHNGSDIIAGWLLGTAVVLLSLAVFDPKPRSIARVLPPLPEAIPTDERHLAVVLNPVKVDDTGQFRAMVEAMAEESGWSDVQWWETTVEDTGYSMAHQAAVGGASLVIAVGGDGTIRAVCEELAGTGIPVGVVPAGTGNLLARNLGIPLYLRAAVDVAMNGQDRAIDMVEVAGDDMEDANFLVMAGMGFDAAIMEGVNEGIKARVGWLAYVWSALKSLMFPAIRVDISLDGAAFTHARARTIVIGNVGHLQAGMPLLPDAAIDDGLLDVVLLYPRRFLSWLPLVARVLTKNPRTDETITRMTGRSVVIRTSTAAPRQLDGDPIRPGRELRAECVHGRLLVRVPR